MILKSAAVKKYKCIMDSGEVRIEQGETCLVGKNDSGKTAFLEALYRLNPLPSGHTKDFDDLKDYPRIIYMDERDEIPGHRPIEAEFELEDYEIEMLEDAFGNGILNSRIIKVSKSYENIQYWVIDINEETAFRIFVDRAGLSDDLVSGCFDFEHLVDKLNSLSDDTSVRYSRNALPSSDNEENVDESKIEQQLAYDEIIERIDQFDIVDEIIDMLSDNLPKFLYFDYYTTMPGKASIPYILNTDEDELSGGERAVLSFLRLAGVDNKEFLTDHYERRKVALEAAALKLSREVFQYWSQNADLRVELDLDYNSPAEDGKEAPFIHFRIWNDRQHISLQFSERSSGFVWFFSFLAYFSEFRNSEENIVLLLDEPGLSLHGAGQRDLLKFIEDYLSPHRQIIYTTHSPYMIDSRKIQHSRTVENVDSKGTIISDKIFAKNNDTILPLLSALACEISPEMFPGENNLLVEKPSDVIYIQIISEYLTTRRRINLDFKWRLIPMGGVDKLPVFIALNGMQFKNSVILNSSTGINKRMNLMISKGLLQLSDFYPLTDVTGGFEADIEDLFSPEIYVEMLNQSEVSQVSLNQLKPGDRILKRIHDSIGENIDTYTVAAYFLRNQFEWLPKLKTETLDKFEALFDRINQRLK